MMREEYFFTATAEWTGGRSGIIEQEGVTPPQISFSAPADFSGDPEKWNPETLLLASVASCYVSTFHAIAEYSSLSFAGLQVSVAGIVRKVENKFKFVSVSIKPHLEIEVEKDRAKALRLLDKAKDSCLVTRSLSAEVTCTPRVELRALDIAS
jgi:peroxiredoxin-like protein